jgi:hypothetical protein
MTTDRMMDDVTPTTCAADTGSDTHSRGTPSAETGRTPAAAGTPAVGTYTIPINRKAIIVGGGTEGRKDTHDPA